jgi:hypothetical protein
MRGDLHRGDGSLPPSSYDGFYFHRWMYKVAQPLCYRYVMRCYHGNGVSSMHLADYEFTSEEGTLAPQESLRPFPLEIHRGYATRPDVHVVSTFR